MTSSRVISAEYPNWDLQIKSHRDKRILDNVNMRKELLRQILAANVSRRMATTPGLDTQPALAKRAGIGQSHVSRLLNAKQSVGLDVVAAVSGALGCQPWELLANDEMTRRAALERMLMGIGQEIPEDQVHRQPREQLPKHVAHKRVPRVRHR